MAAHYGRCSAWLAAGKSLTTFYPKLRIHKVIVGNLTFGYRLFAMFWRLTPNAGCLPKIVVYGSVSFPCVRDFGVAIEVLVAGDVLPILNHKRTSMTTLAIALSCVD